jgi:hypothetical protein
MHHQDEIQYTSYELDFLKTFIVSHGMALYIGRTKSFSTRLKQHLECFYEETNTLKIRNLNESDDQEVGGDINDTSEESSVFGKRFAKINTGQWMKMNDIVVELYKFDEKELESVKRCEYYLNRLFRPILGNI